MATRSLLASRLLRRQTRPSTPHSTSFVVAAARLCCFDGSASKIFPHSNMQGTFVVKSGAAGSCKGTESSENFSNTEPRFNNRSGSHMKRSSRPFVPCKEPVNIIFLNSFTVHQRKFASKSNDDEDIFDDVEARLMRDDDNREDMYMANSAYGMAGTNFDDYGGENEYGDTSWAKDEEDMDTSDEEDDTSDEESDSGNEPSDEEFEGERTDEELDELLANTPLFEPPEPGGIGEPDAEFSFRPEGPVYYPGMEYEPEELDVTRPLPRRRREPRPKQVFSVQEVIDKADFRNVRYLTKFIGETGNILARKEFDMRNKSHGRITKAIKTARFFGLMPYTNMGRPKYVFNEPFDEFSEFYETDEDERKLQDLTGGTTFEGRGDGSYGRFPPRFNGPGMGRRYN